MTNVENCEILTIVEKFIISPHDRCKKLKSTLFCCQISWLAVYTVLPWNLFCRDLRTFCVEKNCSQKCAMWRKNDKYDVCGGALRQLIIVAFGACVMWAASSCIENCCAAYLWLRKELLMELTKMHWQCWLWFPRQTSCRARVCAAACGSSRSEHRPTCTPGGLSQGGLGGFVSFLQQVSNYDCYGPPRTFRELV